MRYALIALLLAGCSTTSGVMEAEGGTYLISARASWELGGTAGANQAAYAEAQKFCQAKGGKAVVLSADERDIRQSAVVGSATQRSAFLVGNDSAMWGNANLRFRCE